MEEGGENGTDLFPLLVVDPRANQGQYAAYQSRTKRPIPVVVLEPR